MEKADYEELQEQIEQDVVNIDDLEEVIEEEEDEVLEESEESEEEDEESDGAEEEESEEESEEEEDEDIISIGDEVLNEPDPEEKKAPKWVRDVRKQNRELQKKLKEYEAKLEQTNTAQAPNQPKSRPEPSLEDHDYDADAFKQDYAKWVKEQAEVERAEREAKLAQEEEAKTWQAKLDAYNENKRSLKVRDYDEVESVILERFSDTQQGVILQGADNPALLVYAIGKSKDKSEALAKIKDPVKFAFEVAKIEANLKVTKRKPSSAPEGKVTGKNGSVKSSDAVLKRLQDEASKTGNIDKLLQYERKLRARKT